MLIPPKNDPLWINHPHALARMVTDLQRCTTISVDTESNGLFAYREQVCLIQFSTGRVDYLVDPLAIDDLSSLGAIFSDPAIEKIFHAAEYDIICMKRDFGFRFANLFDTMLAARILGRPAVGLGSMLEGEFGLQIDKHYQRANWGQRPLTPAMLAYARLDSFYLLPLRQRLFADLEATGRWPLAQEDFVRICEVQGPPPDNGNDMCWRINGVRDLSPQQATVLEELCRYRDQQARHANLPTFKVFSNETLLTLAAQTPRTLDELAGLVKMQPHRLQRFGYGLLDAVQRGLQAPPVHRPRSERPDETFMDRLEMLRNWRKKTAQAMGVESDVILPRDVLETIAQATPLNRGVLAQLMHSLPYRYEQFGQQILQLLLPTGEAAG